MFSLLSLGSVGVCLLIAFGAFWSPEDGRFEVSFGSLWGLPVAGRWPLGSFGVPGGSWGVPVRFGGDFRDFPGNSRTPSATIFG